MLFKNTARVWLMGLSVAALLTQGCGDDRKRAVTVVPDGGADTAVEPLRIVAGPSTLAVTEGGSAAILVSLNRAPAGTVTVNVTSSSEATATVAPTTLTFSPTNFGTPQTVVVTGAQDADTIAETATVTLQGAGVPAVMVAVNVAEDDVQAIVVTPNTLTLTEGGAAATATVRLAFAPTADFAVSVTSSDPARMDVTAAALTFTAANFDQVQTITLTAKDDEDSVTNNAQVFLKGMGVADAAIAVTLIDDDAQSLVFMPPMLTIREGNAEGGAFSVRLARRPDRDINVALAALNAPGVTVTPATLTFTSANFDTAQNVKVVAASDTNTVNEIVQVTAAIPGLTAQTVAVTVEDDDTQAIVATPATVNLTEGASGTFTVRLAFDPGASTTVSVSSANAAAASVSPAVLTFNSENFESAQTVTITGVQDDDVADANVTLTLKSNGIPDATVAAVVNDDDTQAIRVDPSPLSVVEGGTESLAVRLAFRPAAAVTVAVASTNEAVATGGPATVTFTPENFAMAQTVTVSGVADADLLDSTTTVTLSSAGVTTVTVPVTVVDRDTQNFLTTPNDLNLEEAGPAKTFTVRLAFAPPTPLAVTVTSSNPKVMVSPATFNLEGTTAQTLTVTPSQDDDAVDEEATITLTAVGLTPRSVSVNVKDDEVQAHVLNVNNLDVREQGDPGTFTVSLNARPLAATTVTIASSSAGAVAVSTGVGAFGGSATLTFSPDNYNTPQTVSVRGLEDQNLVDESVPVTVSSEVAPTASVLVRNQEDDLQDLVAAPVNITVTEGTPGALQVSLRFQPVTTVAVTVTSANETIAKVNGGGIASLTFTTSNWDQPQNVVVTTQDDPDQVDRGPTTLTVSSTALTDKTINVTAVDDDDQAIVVSSNGVPVTETQTATFTVRLAFTPLAATEVITVTSANTAKVTLSPATLTFDAANYNMPQTITLTGVDDVDLTNESVVLTLKSNAATTPDETVTVSVADNDVQALLRSKSSVDLIEGAGTSATSTFTVTLQFDPTADLTVNLASSDEGAVTVSPATLVFKSNDYTMPRTVTVTAVQDPDVRNETVPVNLTAEGVQTASVTVNVEDEDTQGIGAALQALVIEGSTLSVPVKLAAQPTAPLTITATSALPASFTVAPATLTFTAENWNMEQNFVLTGVQDADLDDHVGNLTLAVTSAQGVVPREGVGNHLVEVTVADEDSQTIVVVQEPAAPFVLSVQEQGPFGTFRVKLGRKPRNDQNDVVVLTQNPDAKLNLLDGATYTFTSANWNDFQTVRFRGAGDADATSESVTVSLAITEPADRLPGVTAVPPTATQVVRVIDDEIAVVGSQLYAELSGATEFTRRGNVSFGTTVLGVTGRNAGGAMVVARDSRELDAFQVGPAFANGGATPSTEVIDFDGSGFSVFSTDATGLVYARVSENLATTLTPVTTIAPGAVDEFWPTRTNTGYGVVYRIGTNLFFRTVLLDGTAGSPQPLTIGTPTAPYRANVHFIAGSTFESQSAPYLVIYATATQLRCARLGPSGEVRVDEAFGAPISASSVQNPADPADIALAYYDASVGLVGRKIRAGTTAAQGACVAGATKTLRGGGSGTYRSMPTIAFNGDQYAVAFDVFVNNEDRVGVALWDGAAASVDMLVGGAGTGTTDQGSRPSITWAGDRWVVRYRAETATGVKVRTGSFKTTDLVTP